MPLPALAAIFVVAVLLHNTEEALWLPRWSAGAGRWHRPVRASEFHFAVFVLSLLLVAIAVAAMISGPLSVAAYLFFGYTFAMAANALFPHLAATLASRQYMPGTATGLLMVLPLGAAVLHRAVQDSWAQLSTLAWVAPAVSASLVAAIPLLFSHGRRILPSGGPPSGQVGT